MMVEALLYLEIASRALGQASAFPTKESPESHTTAIGANPEKELIRKPSRVRTTNKICRNGAIYMSQKPINWRLYLGPLANLAGERSTTAFIAPHNSTSIRLDIES